MKDKVFCIVAVRYPPYLGGVERYAYNIAKEIVKSGNRAVVVTSCMNAAKTYERQEDISIYRLPSLGLLNERFPVFIYNKKARELVKKLDSEGINYMVVNTRFYPLSLFGVTYARKRGIPSIVIEHGTGHFTVNNSFWDFLGHIYEHAITNLVKKKCKNFYGVSMACNQWLKHYKITAGGVLYNAVDFRQIEKLLSVGDEKKIREQIQYKEEDFIITYVGRLVKEKGIEKLLLAFQKIRECYPGAKLCVAGDGGIYEKLLKDGMEGVFLLGRIEFPDVVQLLKISKIYVLPTEYPEGLPTSILEAMACKAYVITTKAGGAKEVIIDNTYGKIMENNTATEIQDSIMEALEDEPKRADAAERGFIRVKENFIWEKTCRQLINIFTGR